MRHTAGSCLIHGVTPAPALPQQNILGALIPSPELPLGFDPPFIPTPMQASQLLFPPLHPPDLENLSNVFPGDTLTLTTCV